MNAPSSDSDGAVSSAMSLATAPLIAQGWVVIDATTTARIAGQPVSELSRWTPLWNDLPPDPHLRDGGRYRRRRHGCFLTTPGTRTVIPVAHRPHWQPLEYNALHGGIERWFDLLPDSLAANPGWLLLLRGLADVADALRGPHTWAIEAHLFRIDTTDGIGRPTPEGAHRDGVDLVVVMLIGCHNIKGGETRVFDAEGPHGVRFTLSEPFGALLLDDARVIHETTPIQPVDPEVNGWRDTLVLTFRSDGFQGPAAAVDPSQD